MTCSNSSFGWWLHLSSALLLEQQQPCSKVSRGATSHPSARQVSSATSRAPRGKQWSIIEVSSSGSQGDKVLKFISCEMSWVLWIGQRMSFINSHRLLRALSGSFCTHITDTKCPSLLPLQMLTACGELSLEALCLLLLQWGRRPSFAHRECRDHLTF